jgi:hypothetical protein
MSEFALTLKPCHRYMQAKFSAATAQTRSRRPDMPKPRITYLVACASVLITLQQGGALAQVASQSCVFLPNKIYLYGTTAVEPVIAALGARLSQLDPPYSLLYLGYDGCNALAAVAQGLNIAGAAEFYSIDAAGLPKIDTCSISAGQVTKADVALSDVYYATCPSNVRDAVDSAIGLRDPSVNVANNARMLVDFQGPTQAMVVVVPRANFSTTYLSLDQTRDILACGSLGLIYPFVDPTQIITYAFLAGDQGVKEMTYACLGLGLDQVCVQGCTGTAQWNQEAASRVINSIKQTAAIGYISNEVYDQHRDVLKAVALQGPGQDKAYYPDSDSTRRDRRMVRDGHYMVQGPLHMVALAGADNVPVQPMAQRFVNWMLQKPGLPGEAPLPFNIVDVFAESGVVPACAMRVVRYADGGPFSPYRDSQPCGCYFESQATGVAVPCGCKPCKGQDDCTGAQVCSYGFCE